MSFDVSVVFSNTISGILVNLPWFILIWLGFKIVAREINKGIKDVPIWLNQYFKLQREQIMINKAVNGVK